MNRTGWLIGGIFAAGGVAAVWLACPAHQEQRSAAAQPGSRAVASAKDAFGNRLSGDEAQEPIGEVIEVIDLSQVFEPKAESYLVPAIEFNPDAFNTLAVAPNTGTAPAVMPHAAEDAPWPRVVGDEPARRGASAAPLRYGEETSEPPADTPAAAYSWSAALREACMEWLYRMMPLKGSIVPAPGSERPE